MKVGDLVKYKDHCDATGWIGLVLEHRDAHSKVYWTQTGKTEWIYDFSEVLELVA
jgi:hypothetical protein